ncbi:GNAT family N-acetyltransferase [Miniphocaeibacter massiliensis]|uniref:GNAT family N-acetyltransferase n=1 Tax=Miniphocaeibacter massiliensis TaxID=2041841 RepID=UPI000C1BD506|nr:GNAT family N-acetyltransferase [Miniphocaeibacter massiliensis]
MEQFNLRKTTRKDTALILGFIEELAEYEKMTDDVIATEDLIEEHVFDKERVEVLIAEENNVPIGFCLFFYNFSTFMGKSGIYLEDLYIKPEYRGRGYGKIIFKELAKIAIERNCGRIEWVCLDWNKPAIDFYKKMGAISMDKWSTYRLTGESLRQVAQKET